jgi:hypothetical protein
MQVISNEIGFALQRGRKGVAKGSVNSIVLFITLPFLIQPMRQIGAGPMHSGSTIHASVTAPCYNPSATAILRYSDAWLNRVNFVPFPFR